MSTDPGAAAGWTSRRGLQRARGRTQASRRTVLVALSANAGIAVTKLAGGLLSGSAAMLAEAVHSLADTVNQGFLLLSLNLAVRDPTPDQPFGYGRVRYLWTFMAAMAMFLAGATFAIGFGIYQLLDGHNEGGYLIAYITLAISLAAEGSSWVRAVHQTRTEAADAQLSLWQYVRQTRDPNVKMVVFEDTVALMGIGLAFAGILIHQLTGLEAFDASASIAVGVLLVSVAVWMAHDTSELLVGAAARPAEREALARTLQEFDGIEKVLEVLTMVLGPNSLLVAARVDFAHGLDEDDIESLSEAVDRRLREVVPDVTEVFLDATTTPTRTRRRRTDAGPTA